MQIIIADNEDKIEKDILKNDFQVEKYHEQDVPSGAPVTKEQFQIAKVI